MKQPTAEELSSIRQGAEISAMKPYMDAEIASMQRAVISSVLAAVNGGKLTPEMALAKWMEYVSYYKLLQRFEQKIQIGANIGAERNLDFDTKLR